MLILAWPMGIWESVRTVLRRMWLKTMRITGKKKATMNTNEIKLHIDGLLKCAIKQHIELSTQNAMPLAWQ